jgi:uncharacterized membrane protein SirB2
MDIVKIIHVTCAILTVMSFTVRGFWMIRNYHLLQSKPVKIIPHIIDAVLLLSGIILVMAYYRNLFQHEWLLIKLVGVVLYIITGSIALKYGRTKMVRILALIVAWCLLAVIITIAMTRDVTFLLSA